MSGELKRPLVVGTLTASTDVEEQIKRARSARVDLVEVRLDTFPFLYVRREPSALRVAAQLLNLVAKKSGCPLLLTLRSHTECGHPLSETPVLSDAFRWRFYQALLPLCRFVDVEVRHDALAKKVTALAHRRGVKVIQSFHDFGGVPSIRKIMAIYRKATHMKADIFKAAVTPRTSDELDVFMNWGLSLKKPRPVLIGMGTLGEISRYAGFSFGSVLTYGHLGGSSESGLSKGVGQPSAVTLAKSIRSLYK